jgi:hypothetical protein
MEKILRRMLNRKYIPFGEKGMKIGLRGENTTDSTVELDSGVKEAVLKAATEGRITCPEARGLADRLGVDPSVIGEACNQLGIRIKGCALGCF